MGALRCMSFRADDRVRMLLSSGSLGETFSANFGRSNRFMYGGADSKTEESYNDVYVLSLPGFVWFRADDRSQERRAHPACVVVGKGKRQMLSIGGKEIKAKWSSADSFPQGLGIFDMTALTWSKDGTYNADMDDYESPGVARDWYSKER